MNIYFVRHGQSFNNDLPLVNDSNVTYLVNPNLTYFGSQQSEKLANYLEKALTNFSDREDVELSFLPQNKFKIIHLYCSPMVRTLETGVIIAKKLDMPLIILDTIHENGGLYWIDKETGKKHGLPGENRAYFERIYSKMVIPDYINEQGWWNREYEENNEASSRACIVFNKLIEKHGVSEDQVILISHERFYNYFIKVLLGLGAENNIYFMLNNAAISLFSLTPGNVNVIYLNRTEHLR